VFGTDGDHAVIRTDYGLEVTKTADVQQSEIVVHDTTLDDPSYAYALSRLSTQDLDHVVTGIYRNTNRPTYDDTARAQVTHATNTTPPNLQALLNGNDTWTVS
jgi:2-oxoglutarate ferredoxin oxidoreductase subunit beta